MTVQLTPYRGSRNGNLLLFRVVREPGTRSATRNLIRNSTVCDGKVPQSGSASVSCSPVQAGLVTSSTTT
jgi:hypothetical protein